MIYAQITNNIIMNILELDDSTLVPIFTTGFDSCIQIDNLTPIPTIGWQWDVVSSTFSPPAILALIQNNIVISVIQNWQCYIINNASNYQYIVDVSQMNWSTMMGWGYNGTSFTPSQAYLQASVTAAMTFGTNLLIQTSARNISMGITQLGQTEAVMSYCSALITSLFTGSLYAAINQINIMIADTSSTKVALAPFVTNDNLYNALNQIQNFLGIPLTPNPGP